MRATVTDKTPTPSLNSASALLARAREVRKQEGLTSLIRAVWHRYILDVIDFHLYVHHHEPPLFVPPIVTLPEHTERFIYDNAEADEVAVEHEDLRDLFPRARRGLENGAVVFCVYSGWRLAHVAWVATSSKARRAVDPLRYRIDFRSGEAWTGAAYTMPPFRHRGLLGHGCMRRFEYLMDLGVKTSRAAIDVKNESSHYVTMKFQPDVIGIGRQVKFLGYRWWSQSTTKPYSTL